MIIPNLIIPGAGKSGTSSLHEYLKIHPEIAMSSKKEPHFFTKNERFNSGLDFYNSFFPETNEKKFFYYGESSTSYFPNKVALDRIKKTLGPVKFIVILRNPIKRTISHYKWLVAKGTESGSFRDAVLKNKKNEPNYQKPEKGGVWKGYYTTSLYGKHLKYLYSLFPKENILVITTEDLAEQPLETLNKCFVFLGVKKLSEISEIRTNVTSYKKKFLIGLKHAIRKELPSLKKDPKVLFKIPIFAFKEIVRKHKGKKLINGVNENDERWLLNLLEEDILLFKNFHPEIGKRWNL